MTGEHDYDIYDQPVACRNCGRLMENVRADLVPMPCAGTDGRRLEDMLDDGSIARRLEQIQADERREW